jgi:hypothetical protein
MCIVSYALSSCHYHTSIVLPSLVNLNATRNALSRTLHLSHSFIHLLLGTIASLLNLLMSRIPRIVALSALVITAYPARPLSP